MNILSEGISLYSSPSWSLTGGSCHWFLLYSLWFNHSKRYKLGVILIIIECASSLLLLESIVSHILCHSVWRVLRAESANVAFIWVCYVHSFSCCQNHITRNLNLLLIILLSLHLIILCFLLVFCFYIHIEAYHIFVYLLWRCSLTTHYIWVCVVCIQLLDVRWPHGAMACLDSFSRLW